MSPERSDSENAFQYFSPSNGHKSKVKIGEKMMTKTATTTTTTATAAATTTTVLSNSYMGEVRFRNHPNNLQQSDSITSNSTPRPPRFRRNTIERTRSPHTAIKNPEGKPYSASPQKLLHSSSSSGTSHKYLLIFLFLLLAISTSFTLLFHSVSQSLTTSNIASLETPEFISSAHFLRKTVLDSLSASSNNNNDGYRKASHKPRIIYLEKRWTFEEWSNQRFTRQLELTYNDNISEHSWRPPEGKCIPKAKWQTASYPNCNNVHEIDFGNAAAKELIIDTSKRKDSTTAYYSADDDLHVLGEGWFRTTWRLDRFNAADLVDGGKDMSESLVLKTLRIQRDFLSEYYDLHRRDAVAMERLTASAFVVNVYGYCGQSAINELADFPFPGVQNLEAFNRRMRGKDNHKTAQIKLRMAASIALGLADIHAAGEDKNPSDKNRNVSYADEIYMTHYDMNPRNIALFSGGRPKINDFNIAEFLQYDPKTNQTCGFPSRLHEPWWRAPEEMNTEEIIQVDEKVDVYALGNILFHTLTTHAPWGKMKKERIPEIRPQVAKGVHPPIPSKYEHDKDPHIQAIIKAIKLCWVKDPKKRASAEEVAALLYDALVDVKDTSGVFGQVDSDKNSNEVEKDGSNDDSGEGEVEDKNVMGH